MVTLPFLKNKKASTSKKTSPGLLQSVIDGAKNWVETIQIRMDNLGQSNYSIGHYHLRAGNDFDAVIRFRMAIKRMPDAVDPHFYLGRLYFHAKKEKTKAQGVEKLKSLAARGGAMATESKYVLACDKPAENSVTPRSIPFRLMCNTEQNLTQFKDESLPRYMRYDPLCLPELEEETSEEGEVLQHAMPRQCTLYLGKDAERKYAMRLVNLITDSCSLSPEQRVLIAGDRYGHFTRYIEEKDVFPTREHAGLAQFIPKVPQAGDDAARKNNAKQDTEISDFAQVRLGAFDVVICPYWCLYFAKPSDLFDKLGAIQEGSLAAFGVIDNADEESARSEHHPFADVFSHNANEVRKDMEEAGFEYIATRPLTLESRNMRRRMCVFRKKRAIAPENDVE